MHIIKHRSINWGGDRIFSIVGEDLIRLQVVAAWLDKIGYAKNRMYWCAVRLKDPATWQIAYAINGKGLAYLDQFERDYYSARKSVQMREFPGYRWYAGIKPRVIRPKSP